MLLAAFTIKNSFPYSIIIFFPDEKLPRCRQLLCEVIFHLRETVWIKTPETSATPWDWSADITCVCGFTQSDWGCNSGHLFIETDLHGKWLINAGAWMIVRFPRPQWECLRVYYLSHNLNPKRFLFLCVGHFCFIRRRQLPLLPTPRGSTLW